MNNIKQTNICTIGFPEEKEKVAKKKKKLTEITTTENLPNQGWRGGGIQKSRFRKYKEFQTM